MAGLYFDPNTGQPTDNYTPAAGSLPPLPSIAAAAAAAPKGNALTAGLAAGYHEAVGQLGSFQEAAGQAMGLPSLQAYGRSVAENRKVLADQAGRPDLEANPWSPSGMLYQVAKAIPAGAGMIGAGVAGAALAPEAAAGAAALGAGALAGYPLMVGGNVEASKASHGGELTAGEGGKALAYGVPEAAIGALGPGMLGKTLVGGVAREGLAKSIAGRAILGAAETAPVMGAQSAVNTAIVQSAFGDPNMPVGDRAREIVNSFFSGGLVGGVLGGATHAISRSPNLPNEKLAQSTDEALGKATAPAPEEAQPLQLTDQRPQLQIENQPDLPKMVGDQGERFVDTRPEAGDVATTPPTPEEAARLATAGDRAQVTTDEIGQTGFALMGNDELMQARAALDRRANDSDRPISDLVDQQIAQRTQPGLEAGQGTLFTPEEMGARKPLNDTLKAQALDGVRADAARDFVDNIKATNQPEMINELSQALVDTPALKKTPWFRTIAQKFDVMDSTGKVLDVDTLGDRLSTLQSDIEKLWNRSKREGDGPARAAQAKQVEARTVQAQIDAHTQADELLTKARGDTAERSGEQPGAAGEPETSQPAPTPAPEPAAAVSTPETPPSVASALSDAGLGDATHWQAFEQKRATLSPPGDVTSTPESRLKAFRDQRFAKGDDDTVLLDRARGEPGDDRTAQPGALMPDAAPRPRTQAEAMTQRSRDIQRAADQGSDTAISAETAARAATTTENLRSRLTDLANDDRLSASDRAQARAGTMAVSSAKMQEIVSKLDPATKRTVGASPAGKQRAAAYWSDLAERKATEAGVRAKDTPSFAEPHTADVNGQTVFENGDHALVRGVDDLGDPIYIAADRATGQRTVTDISKAQAPWITPEVRQRLMTERAKAERADQAAFEREPDGPFKTASRVTATDSVEPQYTQFVDDLMRGLGLGNIKVFLTTPKDMQAPDAVSRFGLNGPYRGALAAGLDDAAGSSMAFGPDGKQFAIHFDPNMPEARAVETLAHEVGHVVYTVAYRNAPPNVQAQIDTAFHAFLKNTTGASLADLVKATRNRATAEVTTRGIDRDAMGSMDQRAYYRAKSEWFADQVSRYATMEPDAPPPRTMIGKFFDAVAQKIKSMIGRLRGDTDVTPTDAVKDFLDNMRPDMADTFMREDHGAEPTRNFDTRPAEAGTTQQQERDYSRFGLDTSVIGKVADRALEAIGQGGVDTLRGSARRLAMGFADTFRLGRLSERLFDTNGATPMADYIKAGRTADVIDHHLARTSSAALDKITKADPKVQADVFTLVQAAIRGLDPVARSWQQHPEFHTVPDAAARKAMFDAAKSAADRLRTGQNLDAYTDMASMHRAALYGKADELMTQALADTSAIPNYGQSAARQYQFTDPLHGNVQATHDFFQKTLQDHVTAIAQARDALTAGAAGDAAKIEAVRPTVAMYNEALALGTRALAEGKTAPYFSAGRTGDFFVAAHLPMENGAIKAGSAEALQARLTKGGFGDVAIDSVGPSRVFIRVKNENEMQSLETLMRAGQTAGELDQAQNITRGRPENVSSLVKDAPAVISRIVNRFSNSDQYGEHKDQIVRELTRAMLDITSPDANARALQQRMGVQGYSSKAIDNFANRQMQEMRSLANLAASSEKASAMEGLRARVEASKSDPNLSTAQRGMMQDTLNELQLKEAGASWRVHSDFLQAARSFTHTFQIGGSLGYSTYELAAVATHLVPELGKENGYGKTTAAVGAASLRAIKAMKAIWNGPEGWDMTIARDAMIKNGIPAKDVDTILMQQNMGNLNIGAPTRNLADVGKGVAPDTGMDWVKRRLNFTATATELFPRLTGALAAGDLWDANPKLQAKISREDYTSRVLSDGLQNWNSGNASRQTSRIGFAGALTPNITQFSGYQTQFVGKLYQEMGNAIGRLGATPEDAAASRRWLMGHAVAMTAVAGTLGMPFTTAIAGAYNKLANLVTGKDDYDVEGDYRSWLAGVFGKEASEVISKGLPRAIGLDASDVGDQDLLPFTRLLSDRSKLQDRISKWASEAMGSPLGMVTNSVLGMQEMSNGNFLAGAQRMVPAFMRGGIEATRMSMNGYENSKGVKLPIDPTTQDIIMRAIGLHPADLALERERDDLAQGLKETKNIRRTQILDRFERGFSRGDQSEMDAARSNAADYMADHPHEAVALNTTLRGLPLQSLKDTAIARATGMPLGVGMKDVETRRRLNF